MKHVHKKASLYNSYQHGRNMLAQCQLCLGKFNEKEENLLKNVKYVISIVLN